MGSMGRKILFVLAGFFLLIAPFLFAEDNSEKLESAAASSPLSEIQPVLTRPTNLYPELPHKEFIFPPKAVHTSHASSIVELPDGELFAVWYAPPKWSPDAVIWGSRRPVGSEGWTTPSIIAHTIGYSNKNPVLFLGLDNKLFLFWGIEKRIFKMVKDTVRMKTSDDYGRTWSNARNIDKLSWFLPKTHPLRLHNGDIVLPIYTDLSTSSAVAISKDGGLTWGGPEYILFLFGIQPTIIERSDFSLFTLMRCGMPPRLAWQAASDNSGKSWRDRKYSNVYNPGTSLEMIKLGNGHVVLAFNDSKKDLRRLLLALSLDEGRSWPYKRVIESETIYPNTYPSVMQDRHGLIHVLYSYNGRESIAHFVTDEEWIKGGKDTENQKFHN